MKILSVLYYYYYLFYKKVLKDDEPHMLTTMAISASEGFLINGIIYTTLLKFFCYNIGKWPMLGVLGLLLVINYLFYHKSERGKKIVILKPTLFGSNTLSIVFTISFFLVTASWLFWGPIYGKILLENCP